MRHVPPDLTLEPVPDDFAITTTDDGTTVRWDGQINGKRYHMGVRPERTPTALAEAAEHLRIGVWQLGEFARLQRGDLMGYASVDRHKGRKRG